MSGRIALGITCAVIAIVMVLCNKKVGVYRILGQQFRVFTNNKNNKFSLWDLTCFIVMPLVIGAILAFGLNCVINNELAAVFTTVFSFVFTILFGFVAILVSKLDSASGIVKRVIKETFVSLMTCTLLALVATILSIGILLVQNIVVVKILSFGVLSLSFIMIMLILMCSKRTYIIYCENEC